MSFASLMVYFDGTAVSYPRLRLAVDLANRLGATLIGVAGRSYLSPLFVSSNDQREADEQQVLKEAENKFRQEGRRLMHVEWRGIPDDATNVVTNQARAADLIIIGREQGTDNWVYAVNPGITILRAGRPVLVIPEGIEVLTARRIMVAWKDTREARCAVRDVIPFLKQAEKVTIVEICEHGTATKSQRHLDDVAQYLFGHQIVVADKASLETEQTLADALLSFAKDNNTDLIVAGGYGHSRLGEWIFVGVTRSLLMGDSPICNLFSH